MGSETIAGIFDSVGSAEQARRILLEAGVPGHRIAVSSDLTADGIAAEAPGQSFENQPGQRSGYTVVEGSRERRAARFGEAVRSGVCVVSVHARSDEEKLMAEALMRRNGAHRTC
jgi:hypothetical protein